MKNLTFYDAPVSHIAYAPNGEFIATVADETLIIWKIRGLSVQRVFVVPNHGTSSSISCVDLSNHFLATGARNIITLRRFHHWDEPIYLELDSAITALKFSDSSSEPPLLTYGRCPGVVGVFDLTNLKKTETTVSKRRINSLAVLFPHTLSSIVSAGDDGRVVQLILGPNFELEKITIRKAASKLLDAAYLPPSKGKGASMLKNGDRTEGVINGQNLTIMNSFISADAGKIEYGTPSGRFAKSYVSLVNTVQWVGEWPFNLVTGRDKSLILWGIRVKPKFLTRWLSKSSTVSLGIEPNVAIEDAHRGKVTALAYPSLKSGPDVCLASGSVDSTVKLWRINEPRLRASAVDDAWKSVAYVGTGAMLPPTDGSRHVDRVSAEHVLALTLEKLGARKRD